jgi:hypothetical protein
MEQIDITLVVSDQGSRWTENDGIERNEIMARFPHGVPVATSFREADYAEEWLASTIGPRGSNWEFIFYYKQAYDFGYAEFFFQEKGFSIIFANNIPNIYGVFANGKKLKTNYQGEYYEAD